MTSWIYRRRQICTALALMVAGCSDGTEGEPPGANNGDGGSAGETGQVDCISERNAYADAALSNQSCSDDSDCTFYASPCIRTEVGNCAGLVYVNKEAEAEIDAARSDYEECSGEDCVNGGSCGLGPALPALCVDQICVGYSSSP